MSKKLSVKDSVLNLGIAYYLDGSLDNLKKAYKTNKKNMSHEAKQVMRMMISSKNPVAVLNAGIEEVFKDDSQN